MLPEIRGYLQDPAEFYLETIKYLPRLFPLDADIARGGDKNADRFHLPKSLQTKALMRRDSSLPGNSALNKQLVRHSASPR